MDDFVLSNLQESKNEWCSRLVSIFTPLVIEGVRSIFNESLEDLITCVHIIQLKVLTCIRVGNKQKKIDISIPKLDNFIHKVYIHVARKVYTNVYLFEKSISPLLAQRNSRELELIVQECILTTIRESIPTEEIIRAYMDESIEQEEEVIIENIVDEVENKEDTSEIKPEEKKSESDEPELPPVVPAIKNIDNEPVITRLSFNDYDSVQDAMSGDVSQVNAPKTIERLEEISTSRAIQRKLEEEEEDGDINDRIKIHTDSINLDDLDIFDFDKKDKTSNVEVLLDDIEELV